MRYDYTLTDESEVTDELERKLFKWDNDCFIHTINGVVHVVSTMACCPCNYIARVVSDNVHSIYDGELYDSYD